MPSDRFNYEEYGPRGPEPPPRANGHDPAPSLGEWDAGLDTDPIPPRQWLMAAQFCRGFTSSLVAAGASAKTTLRIAQALALVTGRKLTGQHVFGRFRVLFLCFEDGKEELRRRVRAAMLHHGVMHGDAAGWLYLAAPMGLRLATLKAGAPHVETLDRLLRETIARLGIDLVILDPLVKLHALPENDNAAMDFVGTLLSRLAVDCNIAVDFPHHVRKGANNPGDADSGRGGGAVRDGGRLGYTLTKMSEAEAELFGVAKHDRGQYVRLDHAKVNLAPPGETMWFRVVGVPLNNGNDQYPNGDEVQTIEPWTPPTAFSGLPYQALNAALDEIEAGLPSGQRFSAANAARQRAAWAVVQRYAPDKTEAQCRAIVAVWLKSGLLFTEEYHDPVEDKQRVGLRVDATKRPGARA